MSDDEDLPDLGGPLPLDLQRMAKRLTINPTTEVVRPCDRFEPETKEWDGVTTIATRFAAITTELPLAGADAMKPVGKGGLAITA